MIKIRNEKIKKNLLPIGPWQEEPDFCSWTNEETGYSCLMVRWRSVWCGYSSIPDDHCINLDKLQTAHITWRGKVFTKEDNLTYPIDLTIKYVGFSCDYISDLNPHLWTRYPDQTYKNEDFVKNACDTLAKEVFKRYRRITDLRKMFCTCTHLESPKVDPSLHENCVVASLKGVHGGMRKTPIPFKGTPWRESRSKRGKFSKLLYHCGDITVNVSEIMGLIGPKRDLVLMSFYNPP